MSHKTKSRAENNNSDQKGAFFQEIPGLFLLAGAVFICASLLSYSPEDPSLTHYALKGSTNWMGPVGANLAAFLVEALGLASWWIPVILTAMAWSLFCSKKDRLPSFPLLISGCTAMLLATSMAFALSSTTVEGPTVTPNAASGGIVGLSLTVFFINWIGEWGTILSGVVLFITGLLAATPFSLACIWPAISSIRIRGLFQRTKVHKPLSQNMRQTSLKDANPEGPVTDIPKIIHSRKNSDKKGLDVKGQGHSKFQMSPITGDFSLPPLTLLNDPPEENEEIDREIYLSNARLLEKKLLDFGVAGNVVEICPGPVVTMYEYSPAPGIKINKVASLADDLALALRTHSVRIVAPIPGKAVIGIELANTTRHIIYLKEILSSNIFQKTGGRLLLTLGQDIVGQPVVTDLTKMPHLLIAGATGTGKSVGLNALICSLLYGHHPDRLRFLMIDPKRIELSLYDGIPHLLHPVVSEPKEATRALRWAVMEMERRYKLLEEAQARNLQGYNKTAEEPLPYLIIVIDELADLMIVSSKEVESAITRLAQMARAAGIHLIVATQRPSVDVLTGLIKANFPARISFKVSSKVDSRTILDIMGAERLLGMGDMLFLPPGSSALKRIHGAYVSEKEIVRVVEFLKAQGEPDYDQTVIEPIPGEEDSETSGPDGESVDVKYDEAVEIVTQTGQASISMLQRRLRVGYNRAARMIEQMEHAGVVSPTDNMGRRHVLVRKYE
ncbi:MAG: DNA translocase FtsK 4TM domain-containing protein [Deltaproteobacteria bacterium]|nr:DNA translocase FtsK 4TM domain-containing protein [Deltaproteobacteria bacterium]